MDRPVLPAIAIGGVLGAATRALVVELVPTASLPWGVLVVNVVGSALLGWAATRLLTLPELDPQRRRVLALASGFCGSLTTFSGFVVAIADNLRSGSTSTGLSYLAASALLGAGAVWLGHRAAAAASPTAPRPTGAR